MIFKKRNKERVIKCVSLSEFDGFLGNGYINFTNHPDVKACIKVIADIVSNTTIHLLESGKIGNIKIKNGLSRRIDIEPNDYVSRQALYYKVVEELLLYGNSFLLPSYSVKGYLERLKPIPQNKVIFEQIEDGGYRINIDNNILYSDNVVHFVNNPIHTRPWQGESYKVYLNDILKNLSQSQEIKFKYYKEHFRPSLVFFLHADNDVMDEEERENLFSKFIKVKPGQPYVLPETLVDFKEYKPMNLTDIAINESVEIDKKYLASLFSIPPFLLGVGDFNAEEYNLFIDRTIKRICNIISSELTRKLILSDNIFFRFNADSQKIVDPLSRFKLMFEGKARGFFNGNECRVAMGYEPIDDEKMNEFTILENYIPIADSGNQKKLNSGGE